MCALWTPYLGRTPWRIVRPSSNPRLLRHGVDSLSTAHNVQPHQPLRSAPGILAFLSAQSEDARTAERPFGALYGVTIIRRHAVASYSYRFALLDFKTCATYTLSRTARF